MKPYILSTHSFVDLITNSSSEIFICNDDRPLDTIKQIIIALAKIHNQKVELGSLGTEKGCWGSPIDIDRLFIDIFREPRICRWTIDLYRYPNRDSYFDIVENAFKNKTFCRLQRKATDWVEKNRLDYDDIYGLPEEQQSAAWEKRHNGEKEIMKPWREIYDNANDSFLSWVFEQNGLVYDPTLFTGDSGKPSPEMEDLYEQVRSCVGFDYTVKKGQLLLESVDDNSIPYWMFEDLDNIFHAQHHHLG